MFGRISDCLQSASYGLQAQFSSAPGIAWGKNINIQKARCKCSLIIKLVLQTARVWFAFLPNALHWAELSCHFVAEKPSEHDYALHWAELSCHFVAEKSSEHDLAYWGEIVYSLERLQQPE